MTSDRNVRKLVTLVLTTSFLTLACQTISKEAKEDLAKPVNCETALQDIMALENEKASVMKQIAEGVTAVAPAGAVIGILTLQEGDKLKVAVGEYNHQITEKIKEIKTTCGLEG
jgi:hypothetical protein